VLVATQDLTSLIPVDGYDIDDQGIGEGRVDASIGVVPAGRVVR
jgi:hypothetical protein